MPRYILISFVFMGWAFYEMSGGSDFEPREKTPELTAEAPAPEQPATTRTRLQTQQTARASDAASLVTTTSVSYRAEIAPRPSAEEMQARNEANMRAAENEQKLEQVRASLRTDMNLAPSISDSDFKIASLSDLVTDEPMPDEIPTESVEEPAANQGLTETVRAPVSSDADLREIVATRVNMRAGPSTADDVLVRLERGHTVEVLGDNGAGWLRLRALPEDRVGWIAERLVSPAN